MKNLLLIQSRLCWKSKLPPTTNRVAKIDFFFLTEVLLTCVYIHIYIYISIWFRLQLKSKHFKRQLNFKSEQLSQSARANLHTPI